MEFNETPRFWCPRVALVVWINFAFSPNENLRFDFHRSEKEMNKEINKKKSLSNALSLPLSFVFFPFYPLFLFYYYYYYYYYYFGYGSYCFIQVPFYPETIYFFSVHFILNELSPSHFLTSEIFIKISPLKSLMTYHPENRKIFRLSQNSTKFFWVTRFCETNLTVQSVSSSEI